MPASEPSEKLPGEREQSCRVEDPSPGVAPSRPRPRPNRAAAHAVAGGKPLPVPRRTCQGAQPLAVSDGAEQHDLQFRAFSLLRLHWTAGLALQCRPRGKRGFAPNLNQNLSSASVVSDILPFRDEDLRFNRCRFGPRWAARGYPCHQAGQAGRRDRKMRTVGGACINTGTIPSKTMREAVLHFSGYNYRSIYGANYRVKEKITVADLAFRCSTSSRPKWT